MANITAAGRNIGNMLAGQGRQEQTNPLGLMETMVNIQRGLTDIEKTRLGMESTKQEQRMSGFAALTPVIRAMEADPSMNRQQAEEMLRARMELMSPEARSANAKTFNSFMDSVYANLPNDPKTAAIQRQQRINNLLVQTMPPDELRKFRGIPEPGVREGPFGPEGAPIPYGVGLTPAYSQPGTAGVRDLSQPSGAAPAAPGGPAAAPAPAGTPTSTTAPGAGGDGNGGGEGPSQPPVERAGATPALLPEELRVASPKPETGRLMGVGVGEKAKLEEQAKADVSMGQDISAVSGPLYNAANRVTTLMDTLQYFRSGGFARGGTEAGRIIRGLGDVLRWNEKTTEDLANKAAKGSLADAQLFKSLIGNEAIRALKEAAVGTGRIMRPEVDAAMAGLSADMEPEALFRYMNRIILPALQKDVYSVETFPQYRKAVQEGRMPGRVTTDYPGYVTTYYDPRQAPLYTKGGIYIGPRDESQIAPARSPPPPPPPPRSQTAPTPPAPGQPAPTITFGTPPSMR